ncbi:MAG: SDR family oxidoreductase, partial [Ottowia sp.]|nr:SDR family oxidoreductase [Ottowia sp.]
MHIVITGGAGFLGVRLARALLARATLALAGDAPRPLTRLTLVDRIAPPAALAQDPRVHVVTGDLDELLVPDTGG